MSYKNFRRTVIIPQGKFQEFLQLKDTERLEMLEEIFGLERFNLHGRVSRLKTATDMEASRLEGVLGGLGTVTPQEAEALEGEKIRLNGEQAAAEERTAALREKLRGSDEIAEAAKALEEARIRLAAARTGAAAAKEREETVDRYEVAGRDLLPVHRSLTERRNHARRLEEELGRLVRKGEELGRRRGKPKADGTPWRRSIGAGRRSSPRRPL